MKAIIEKESTSIKYLLQDTDTVILSADSISVKTAKKQFVIGDLNSDNAMLVENLADIQDFIGNKYLYNAGEILINPAYVEVIPQITEEM